MAAAAALASAYEMAEVKIQKEATKASSRTRFPDSKPQVVKGTSKWDPRACCPKGQSNLKELVEHQGQPPRSMKTVPPDMQDNEQEEQETILNKLGTPD